MRTASAPSSIAPKRGAWPWATASRCCRAQSRRAPWCPKGRLRALGSMAPVDTRCGAGFGCRGGSQRATARCRLAGERCFHYPRSLRTRSRRRAGIRRATSILPSGMGTPRSSRERPRVSRGLAPSGVRLLGRISAVRLRQASSVSVWADFQPKSGVCVMNVGPAKPPGVPSTVPSVR